MIFPRIPQNKNKILIAGIIILVSVVIGFLSKDFWFPKVSCVLPGYDRVGASVSKSYPNSYLSLVEWQDYNDPEVEFFLSSEAQQFINSKLSGLKGYNGLTYSRIDKLLSIDKGYRGVGCQPLRYYYNLNLNATISGKNLASSPFEPWYYIDRYNISAAYQPNFKKWTEFKLTLTARNLIPATDLNKALKIVQASTSFKEITRC